MNIPLSALATLPTWGGYWESSWNKIFEVADSLSAPLVTAPRAYHLSNFAMDSFSMFHRKTCVILYHAYEDNDLEGWDFAKEAWKWLSENLPGYFILIDTGDYIHGKNDEFTHEYRQWLQVNNSWKFLDDELYDPYYTHYLMPHTAWDAWWEVLNEFDLSWRYKAQAKANRRVEYLWNPEIQS